MTRSSLTGSPCPLLCSQPFTGDHRENPFRGSWLLLINQSINHSANPSPRLQLGQGRECAGRLNEFLLWMGTKLETPRLSPDLPRVNEMTIFPPGCTAGSWQSFVPRLWDAPGSPQRKSLDLGASSPRRACACAWLSPSGRRLSPAPAPALLMPCSCSGNISAGTRLGHVPASHPQCPVLLSPPGHPGRCCGGSHGGGSLFPAAAAKAALGLCTLGSPGTPPSWLLPSLHLHPASSSPARN